MQILSPRPSWRRRRVAFRCRAAWYCKPHGRRQHARKSPGTGQEGSSAPRDRYADVAAVSDVRTADGAGVRKFGPHRSSLSDGLHVGGGEHRDAPPVSDDAASSREADGTRNDPQPQLADVRPVGAQAQAAGQLRRRRGRSGARRVKRSRVDEDAQPAPTRRLRRQASRVVGDAGRPHLEPTPHLGQLAGAEAVGGRGADAALEAHREAVLRFPPQVPLDGTARTSRDALKDAARYAVVTWFDIINSGVYVYKSAIAERDWRAATPALVATFQAASAVYALGYGKNVNVNMIIKSQDDLY